MCGSVAHCLRAGVPTSRGATDKAKALNPVVVVWLQFLLCALVIGVMNGIAIVELLYRPAGRVLRAISWVSLALVAVYLFNAYVLFLHVE